MFLGKIAMSNIFELTRIRKLISNKHPSAVIVVDTNIVVKEPDFLRWETFLIEPLFILSDVIIVELEFLKNKPKSSEDAKKAIKSVNNLFREGKISEGIYKEGVGWFISVPSPKEDSLKVELSQFESLIQAYGKSDVKLLLLTRELNHAVPNIPIIFMTGEFNLFNIAEQNGLPSYQFEGFPISDLEKVTNKTRTEIVDWDKVLAEIQKTTEEKSVEVELKLLAKRCVPRWLQGMNNIGNETIVAEGSGIIYDQEVGNISFSWALLFRSWRVSFGSRVPAIESNALSEIETTSSEPTIINEHSGTVSLDFQGRENEVPVRLRQSLAEKMNGCASPIAYVEDMDTVHDPSSVMIALLLADYMSLMGEKGQEKLTSEDMVKRFQEELKSFGSLVDFAMYWFVGRDDSLERKDLPLSEFLIAIDHCWVLGDTLRFKLIKGSGKSE
jgi:hypothetical protein